MADSHNASQGSGPSVEDVLRGVSKGLGTLAPMLPGAWGAAVTGVGALVEIVAGLIKSGVEMDVAIETMRSALPDYEAARDRLRELLEQKATR